MDGRSSSIHLLTHLLTLNGWTRIDGSGWMDDDEWSVKSTDPDWIYVKEAWLSALSTICSDSLVMWFEWLAWYQLDRTLRISHYNATTKWCAAMRSEKSGSVDLPQNVISTDPKGSVDLIYIVNRCLRLPTEPHWWKSGRKNKRFVVLFENYFSNLFWEFFFMRIIIKYQKYEINLILKTWKYISSHECFGMLHLNKMKEWRRMKWFGENRKLGLSRGDKLAGFVKNSKAEQSFRHSHNIHMRGEVLKPHQEMQNLQSLMQNRW